MATNLWTDVDALMRLADTARAVEGPGPGCGGLDEWRQAMSAAAEVNGARIEIDAMELPARVVSGDFHDAFRLPDGSLAIAIADISGKGVPAGVLRAFACSMVRNVSSFSASPQDTLQRVNRMLYDARLEAMYVTIFLGWLDPASGRLRYANAGPPRPFRINAAGRPMPFGEVTGPILGILDGVIYEGGEETLEPGDALLLYTDGVTEARGASGRFLGTSGLASLLARHASAPAPELCAAVAEAVDRHQGGGRHDDATLLALRYRGVAES